jgi:hypothetical protein
VPQRKKKFCTGKKFSLQFLRAYKVALVHFVLGEEEKIYKAVKKPLQFSKVVLKDLIKTSFLPFFRA